MNTKSNHLICHDHDLAVTQTLQGFWVAVVFLVLEAEDLDYIVDFSVFHDLRTKNMSHHSAGYQTNADLHRGNDTTVLFVTCL